MPTNPNKFYASPKYKIGDYIRIDWVHNSSLYYIKNINFKHKYYIMYGIRITGKSYSVSSENSYKPYFWYLDTDTKARLATKAEIVLYGNKEMNLNDG